MEMQISNNGDMHAGAVDSAKLVNPPIVVKKEKKAFDINDHNFSK